LGYDFFCNISRPSIKEKKVMPVCGARNRKGQPCQELALKGKNRCRLHGGLSTGPPKGSINAVDHGIYVQALTPEEQEVFDGLELGSLDRELKVCRIRLNRALLKEDEQAGRLQLEEAITNTGEKSGIAFPKRTTRKKVRDFDMVIDRLVARITRLELARKVIADQAAGQNDTITGFEVVEYPDD
jgi:hypothetical protein